MYVYNEGHSRIVGTGIYLPEQRITTESLMREVQSKERFGVPYHWIARITGIKEKRAASPDVMPSDMAVSAAKEALERAEILPRQIDAIIYTGVVRDYLEPSTAHLIQNKLCATNAMVFDISNACNGFMNGIHVIDSLIATGGVKYGLVVTGEQGSRFTQQAIEMLKTTTDHGRFTSLAANLTGGDAGAAVVLERKARPGNGFKAFMLHSRGQHAALCTVGGPLLSGPGVSHMPPLIAEASKVMIDTLREFMQKRLGWRIEELAKCLVHQTGTKGLFKIHEQEGIPASAMPRTVETLGNILSATIPLNLHYCLQNKEVKAGDKILLSAAGSGISVCQGGLIWDA